MRMLPILVLASATFLPAQALVNPKTFTSEEGNHAIRDGLGSTGAFSRHLQMHRVINKPTISSIAVRRDGLSFASGTYPSGGLVCDIYMSTAAVGISAIDQTFDNNHGPDKVQVASGLFQFPAIPPGSMPYPFDFKFPFSQPFMFANTNKTLCWDIIVQIRTNQQPMDLDAGANWSSNPPVEVYNGLGGCTATGLAGPMTLTGMSTADWPSKAFSATWVGSNLPPNSNVVMMIGDNDNSTGGLPLPFVLPGSAAAPSGACSVFNNALMMVPVPTDASGGINVTANSFLLSSLGGMSFFTQVLTADAAANPWGVVTSNMVQHHIVRPFPNTLSLGHVFSSTTVGPTGTALPFQGLVTEFN